SGPTRAPPIRSAPRTPRSRPSSREPVSRIASASFGEGTTGRSGAIRRRARCSRPRGTSPGAGMRRVGVFAARGAALPGGRAIVVAATGWLYLVAPGMRLPGPTVGDALPLDELARHSAAPLALFVLAWGGAALALGCLARLLALGRLAAALL